MKFTKKAFSEWLDSKSDRESVGRPEQFTECPLCNFLKAQGAKSVHIDFVFRTVNGKKYSNPHWATAFQRKACHHVDGYEHKYITARTAAGYLG